MAASSSSSLPPTPNIATLVSVKLTDTNYLLWEGQVKPLLGATFTEPVLSQIVGLPHPKLFGNVWSKTFLQTPLLSRSPEHFGTYSLRK